MNQDPAARTSLVLAALVILLAAAYFARPILAPVTFAIFIVAVVWPLQSGLQRRLPKLLALVVTLLSTLTAISVLGYLVIWAFGLVAQWLVSNTARFQALYQQAADWLEAHGVAVNALMATSFNPSWVTGALRGIGGQGYGLLSFVVIAFAFTVLGLLEVDLARANIQRLDNPRLRDALLTPAQEISAKFQKYMLVRSTMSVLTGAVCRAISPAGYRGRRGELWYVRVLPPPIPGGSEHVVFTTPYILLQPGLRDWQAYFCRTLPEAPQQARFDAHARHMKYGPTRMYWNDFVFEAYVNYRTEVIYLAGLPDVPESRPHSEVNQWGFKQ